MKKDRGLFLKDGGLLEKKEDVFCGEGGEGVWYNFSVYARVIDNKVKVDSRAEIIGGWQFFSYSWKPTSYVKGCKFLAKKCFEDLEYML